jgi:antitoxin component of RelBE/YafQ-DinJ toxin-antitoxin module
MELLMAQLRLEIDDELKADAQRYADRFGISLADAVRILIRKGFDAENGTGRTDEIAR